jgi:hypothetical protein
MAETLKAAAAVIGIDTGKNFSHVVGLDPRGATVLGSSGHAAKWKRVSPTCQLA